MKVRSAILISVMFGLSMSPVNASAPGGFFLPDSITEMTLKYRVVKDLVVLPVTINDSIVVNLILDTGCRNLVLFGKKFKRKFGMSGDRPVTFSGLGKGEPVAGGLSIGNTVSIYAVLGRQIPVVIVNDNKLFSDYDNVDGVIGYEIFFKFEIELNARAKTVTFRPAAMAEAPAGFVSVPLRIVDSRPVLESMLTLDRGRTNSLELMVDTGSSLGLLVKTTNISGFRYQGKEEVIGIGLNGPVSGLQTTSRRLVLSGLAFEYVPTGIISSSWHNNASIGMKLLKDYVVVLNYCKGYAGFKRNG